MPSTSQKQHNFWAKCASDPEFARKNNVSQQTAREMLEKDKQSGKFRGKAKKR